MEQDQLGRPLMLDLVLEAAVVVTQLWACQQQPWQPE